MILFHVSTSPVHDGKFYPRIPEKRIEWEDKREERISVSDSIEGCLTAIPGGSYLFQSTNEIQRGYYKVFMIDTEKLGIGELDIITPDELYENGLVDDAVHTDEYWITKPFEVPEEDSFIIMVNDWREEPVKVYPFLLTPTILDMGLEKAYRKAFGKSCPILCKITDVDYLTENIKAGDYLIFKYLSEKERGNLRYVVSKFFPEEDIVDAFGTISVTSKENINLRELYLMHFYYSLQD